MCTASDLRAIGEEALKAEEKNMPRAVDLLVNKVINQCKDVACWLDVETGKPYTKLSIPLWTINPERYQLAVKVELEQRGFTVTLTHPPVTVW